MKCKKYKKQTTQISAYGLFSTLHSPLNTISDNYSASQCNTCSQLEVGQSPSYKTRNICIRDKRKLVRKLVVRI